jgi:two-component system, OmpR family, response regulator ChvI
MKGSSEDVIGSLRAEDPLSLSDLASEEISFLDHSMNCCIGFVDILNSTTVTAEIYNHPKKIGQYYSIFINTMAILVKNYGAKIVKNAGDALIFYFPQTSSEGSSNEQAFNDAFECFTTMILARDIINAKLHSEGLPSVSYRISADYGKVEVATSTSSRGGEDLFGSTMNICAKINSMAEANGIVIGGDLYRIIQSFSFIENKYELRELKGGYSIGFNHKYPVYRASLSKNNNTSGLDVNSINQLLFTPKKTSLKIKDIQVKQQQSQSQLLQSQSTQHLLPQQKHSANIMIVDDEPDILSTYKLLLSAEGYNVQTFTDAQEALKHFVQLPDPSSHYKLVLLDIRMPRLNGLQLFYRIKTLSPRIKIMFSSALDIAEEVVSILPDMKYDDIIKKPVEREYFINKINSALNRSSQTDESYG